MSCREPGQVVDAAYLREGELRYTAEGHEIVGHNRRHCNNRPLYCEPRTEGVVLAGDRPLVRLIAKPYVHGVFSVAIIRQSKGKWFHEYQEVESRYRCGRLTWRITDPAVLPGVSATLEAVPLKGAAGFVLRLKATGLRVGDQLVWTFGGAKPDARPRDNWDPVMRGNPNVCKTGDPRTPQLTLGVVPEWCRGNEVLLEGPVFRLWPTADATQIAIGSSNRQGRMFVVDASAGADPATLVESAADKLPMICGVIELRADEDEIFWAVEVAPPKAAVATLKITAPAQAFADAIAYLETSERVQTTTPDPRLDAAVAAVCHAIDMNCDRNPFVFYHGGMAFHVPFLGWRVICGATALGWHDRVKGNAAHYTAAQVKTDEGRSQPQPDAERRYCHEGLQSRYWGCGHLAADPGHMYNMQSQFFDQTIRDWRWTADRELENTLRPALERHLAWAKDCFDPDDDGLYESYINTLPTDSVWYNGGGSVEESAYAYYGHLAARDMARRAGDGEAAARHQTRAAKIKRALKEVLWCQDRGHFGLYVEQGGQRRVHSDAWVYSQFLPIDAEITTMEEALQALYYTEWGLERIRLPFGGVLCQPSNWVPSTWSVRDMFGGDLWHLALAYFQTGLGVEGWELLLGAMLESAYASAVPGGFSQIGAGTDFADSCHMFARAVVEGLFGFDPDYANGVVRLHPAFPSSWPTASIQTPDYTFDYRRTTNGDTYRLTLARDADVEFRLPVNAEKVRQVMLDGQEVQWQTEAGFGCTWLRLRAPKAKAAEVMIETVGRLPQGVAVQVQGKVGQEICLAVPRGQIVRWQDFHAVIQDAQREGSTISGRLVHKPGHHLVLAEVLVGELPQWQTFKVQVTDPAGAATQAARTPRQAPKDARWECMDLTPYYNGDIRTIFQQQYLSPRPKTCSVRLGVDGYSAWTFPYWGMNPPAIDLANLETLTDGQGRILTAQNVPFARFPEARNIAFTSRWDNWPRAVTVPVNQQAEAIWLLVCGSTFPMQTRIANAELRFHYADGKMEKLELVPPLNFWSLCPWGGIDYSYAVDAFCLPEQPPPTVQLGSNCRAMVLSWKLRRGVKLKSVVLETLSEDVVIGLMGLSLIDDSGYGGNA